MGIMLGSLMEQRKEGQFGIGIRQQIEVVSEVPAVTGRIPSDRAIGLREVAITIAVEITFLPAVADVMGTRTSGSDNGSTIAGNMKLIGIQLSTADGFIQEACTKYSIQQAICFLINTEDGLRKADNEFSNGFLFNGSGLLTLPLWLLDLLPYRRLVVGREIGRSEVPKPVDEVIEGANTRDIPGLKSAEDSKERGCVQGFNPVSDGDDIHHNHEQQGA